MGTRILVVDDEEDTLSLLRTILQISGFEPITTLNSIEAIGLAEVQQPQVVLLDIMMPRLDGFTLCKMMRQNTSTKTLPIIFVTAYESLDLEERRVDAGADMVIRKPIDIDVLVQAIEKTLDSKKMVETPTTVAPQPPALEVVPPPVIEPPASTAAVPVVETQESAAAPVVQTQEHQPVKQDVKAAEELK